MAVYTHVDENALAAFLKSYAIGAPVRFEGIAQGVENTNYFLETGDGRFILTLFEKRVRADDVPYFLAAMDHFAAAGAPTPKPVETVDGRTLGTLADRPAVIISFLDGRPEMAPGPAHCASVGETLAFLHGAASGFERHRANDLSLGGWRRLAEKCRADADRCAPGLAGFIDDELCALSAAWPDVGRSELRRGLVHADLFPDNVFFGVGDEARPVVSGVIDFYFSCTDFFAYDLAVTVNAWASDNGSWRADNAASLIECYLSARPLNDAERDAFPLFLRGAALRFLLTRLHDWLHQVEGAVVAVKDPLEYRDLLARHQKTTFEFS